VFQRWWRSLKRLGTNNPNEEPITAGITAPYKIKVTFVRDNGIEVPGEIHADIQVHPRLVMKVRASLWTEVLRFLLALGIAAVGLIVGAREQVLKLELFSALIAIFLLGFGSDRLKNLFTQQAPTTPAAKEPAPIGTDAARAET
jgi:hypothetical protein